MPISYYFTCTDRGRSNSLAGQLLHPDGQQDQKHPQRTCRYSCCRLAIKRVWRL